MGKSHLPASGEEPITPRWSPSTRNLAGTRAPRALDATSPRAGWRRGGRIRVGEVALQGRPDPGRDLGRWRRGERLDLDDVPKNGEPDELARREARADLRIFELQRLGHAGEHLAADEVPHQGGRLVAGDHGPNQRLGAGARGRIPHVDEEPRQSDPEPVEALGQEGWYGVRGFERKLHRCLEHAVLRLEVVQDELGIDARGAADPADGGALVAELAELGPGGGGDLLPRAALAWPPTGSRHAPGRPPGSRARDAPAGREPSARRRRRAMPQARAPVRPRRPRRSTGRRAWRCRADPRASPEQASGRRPAAAG